MTAKMRKIPKSSRKVLKYKVAEIKMIMYTIPDSVLVSVSFIA